MADIFYTYLYTDPRTSKPIYVGKGHGDRSHKHLVRKDHCEFVHKLQKMKREGVEPDITFLAKDISEDEAFSLEVWFIWKYGRKDLGRGTLLNLTDGGEGPSGAINSPATLAKKSAASRGRPKSAATLQKISANMTGRVFSPESKKKMSESAKTRVREPRSEETRARIAASVRQHFEQLRSKT